MKYQEVSKKSVDELRQIDQDLRKEMFNYRFQKSSGELQKSSEIKKARRNSARVQTALTAKKKESK